MNGSAARVHPIPDEGLGNTSYVVEVARGLAVCIDPPRGVDAHVALADRLGARIVAVLETHLHADFVSGSRELTARTGATIHAPRGADLAFAHSPVEPGAEIAFADVILRAIATPGHTPEHLSYALVQDGATTGVFSGGSLIAGGAARTDLIDETATARLAHDQFHSIRAVAAHEDHVRLHPTHGGGSFCSAGGGGARPGTIGDERSRNPLLRYDDPDAFARDLVAGYGSFPPYFLKLRDANRAGPALLRDLAEPVPMSPDDVHAAVRAGAWLVDGRPVLEWAALHARDAISIAIRPQFASWLGWVVPFGAPVILIADEPARSDAIAQARGIGYDPVLGWLDGGMAAWRAAGLETSSTELVSAEDARAMATGDAAIIDVRQASEWRREHIAGAVHLEVGDIVAGKVPDASAVVTHCNHGERSATAASLLERRGIRVANFPGGLGEWKGSGLPVER